LAGRSKDAAKQIKELIDASVRTVVHGSQRVNDFGHKLADMIASASLLQAHGIE
jgi:methyl-accepting chemotaxis protein